MKGIKDIMIAKGISQTDLAQRICAKRPFVVDLYHGWIRPREETIKTLAAVLQCPVEEIENCFRQ